jgi:hypothetical protein
MRLIKASFKKKSFISSFLSRNMPAWHMHNKEKVHPAKTSCQTVA